LPDGGSAEQGTTNPVLAKWTKSFSKVAFTVPGQGHR
jgi:hypothetical protein